MLTTFETIESTIVGAQLLRRFGLPQQYLDVITAIYKDIRFFVRDAWGESDLRPQAEGLRQGDPLACFLLLILMTIYYARYSRSIRCHLHATKL